MWSWKTCWRRLPDDFVCKSVDTLPSRCRWPTDDRHDDSRVCEEARKVNKMIRKLMLPSCSPHHSPDWWWYVGKSENMAKIREPFHSLSPSSLTDTTHWMDIFPIFWCVNNVRRKIFTEQYFLFAMNTELLWSEGAGLTAMCRRV